MDERRRFSGFTLIEVMVVVLIIGLMSTIVTHQVLKHAAEARVTKANLDVSQLYDAGVMFKVNKGRWPDSLEELVAGRPPYIARFKSAPKDPWGNVYRCQSGSDPDEWEVYSYGPDRGEGGADDISSSEPPG